MQRRPDRLMTVGLLGAACLLAGVPARAQDAADPPVSPAAHARMLEAFARPDIRKSLPTAIVPVNTGQLADPRFRLLANQLAEVLIAHGFNIVARPTPFVQAVTLQYEADLDTKLNLPDQGTSDPSVHRDLGRARFPAYRRITVTAYDLSRRPKVDVLWRTAMDEDGFVDQVDSTIPPLIQAGARYYGEAVTQLLAADCNDFAPSLGSHIPARPCGAARAAAPAPELRKAPRVIVGPVLNR